ncbi:uncharacterized protein [Typha latifolia]|uniref:uncharacterized protein n=1 Tax=Typha latifolia TaxID=4733 RepID=UPI003C2C75F0
MDQIDKRWMENKDRLSNEYRGVQIFLDFAFQHSMHQDQILCPCRKCNNARIRTRKEVYDHLIIHGILRTYTHWVAHGEDIIELNNIEEIGDDDDEDEHDNLEEMMHDLNCGTSVDLEEEPNEEATRFYRLLEDARRPLYPGCEKFSKLSFLVKLFHIECLNNWSDKGFNMIIKLLRNILPSGETLPNSWYKAKQIIKDLGLNYEKIYACVNDCMLYWKDFKYTDSCHICGASRYKLNRNLGKDADVDRCSTTVSKIPNKILHYFPLANRLQRLFMSPITAKDMIWYSVDRSTSLYRVMAHPANSQAWKTFDVIHPTFASDNRNVRLGLATYGFNPFGSMSISYSTWPVVLIAYNLPPWLCMKQPYIMLTLLIPGPKAHRNDIDIYLQPLVEELKQL